jgi:hypothetical protein
LVLERIFAGMPAEVGEGEEGAAQTDVARDRPQRFLPAQRRVKIMVDCRQEYAAEHTDLAHVFLGRPAADPLDVLALQLARLGAGLGRGLRRRVAGAFGHRIAGRFGIAAGGWFGARAGLARGRRLGVGVRLGLGSSGARFDRDRT